MPVRITDENYETYKAFFEVFWKHYTEISFFKLLNVPSPIDVIREYEAKGKGIAKRSLQAGLSDLIFMARDLPPSFIQLIDEDLKDRKLPDFNTFKAAILDTKGKVLKRGKIKNLDEYYFIQEILSDMDNGLSDEERDKLSSLVEEFENKDPRIKSGDDNLDNNRLSKE